MSIVNDALKKLAGGGTKKVFIESSKVEPSKIEPSKPFWQRPSGKLVIIVFWGIAILVILIGSRQVVFKDETAEQIIADQVGEEISAGEIAAELTEEVEKEVEEEVVGEIVEQEIVAKDEPAGEPELSLTGIVWGDESPCAFINNIIVEEGETVDGAKVVRIDRREVLLTFQEKEIYLSLGK